MATAGWCHYESSRWRTRNFIWSLMLASGVQVLELFSSSSSGVISRKPNWNQGSQDWNKHSDRMPTVQVAACSTIPQHWPHFKILKHNNLFIVDKSFLIGINAFWKSWSTYRNDLLTQKSCLWWFLCWFLLHICTLLQSHETVCSKSKLKKNEYHSSVHIKF